ncbi:hypothetical protein SAMN05421788_102363 [Filimonas lacunae]|uniref:Uncharacterized protein n=1 Tax=Filimonas lacunae TaxID=477680 RepID=A0A173MHP6_9BACT|nr:hypothetical protein FLA_3030 [Filimonas lacunae]SIS96461.1 hypothetical protein SAMN05421788_102363 [Filimonas lacunae]
MPRFVHYLYLIPLLFSVIIGLKSSKGKWTDPYSLFAIFLLGSLAVELFAISWKLSLHRTRYWSYSKSNLWIYNLYLMPQYLFYFWFYTKVLESKFLWNYRLCLFIVYTVFGLINLLFVQKMNQLNTYNIIGGNMLIILCSFLYFMQELNRVKPKVVQRDSLFWISLGGFIFNTVSLPYFIFLNYIVRVNLSMAVALFNILLFLNILMYSFYLIAFVWRAQFPKKQF